MNEDGQNKKHFDISLKIRNFEIDLFWKRSLFFWGFISAAFLAYAALRQSELRIVVACFGMVCSCAWTLVLNSWEVFCSGRRRTPSMTGDVGFVAESIR
jgi:ATP-dependent protease ClpP protease subunit